MEVEKWETFKKCSTNVEEELNFTTNLYVDEDAVCFLIRAYKVHLTLTNIAATLKIIRMVQTPHTMIPILNASLHKVWRPLCFDG